MQVDLTPFERIRARKFAGRAFLAFIATLISVIILTRLLPEWFKGKPSPLRSEVRGFLLCVFFFLFAFKMLSRAGLSYNRLFGAFPAWRTLGLYSLWVVPLVIYSIASIYLFLVPLSFLLPKFVEWWLIESSSIHVVWTSGNKYIFANLMSFLTTVVVAPVLEEFFFRGILLTRWTIKWNVSWAIFASSLVFAFLHLNPIGAFCFSYAMAVFYIRTKSLFIPIGIHIVNNGTAWIFECVTVQFDDSNSQGTITEIQESWWIGLVGLVMSILLVSYFRKHYILKTGWRVPYLAEPVNSENNRNSDAF